MTTSTLPPAVLRQHAEQQFADELAILAKSDDRPRPGAGSSPRRPW
ncbi:hypothetical protein [Polymorphospora rubra]|nr:hypothetical protein [Polymorphospora rubra]